MLLFCNYVFVVPQFDIVNVTSTGGNIIVMWSFTHTGGLPLINVNVSCSNGLYCMNCTDTSTVSLLPVMAGSNYTCIVIASNTIGSDTRTLTNIIPVEGQ